MELYRGDLLEGFYVRQAPAFEEWVLAQRVRLRDLALDALHTLAVHHTRRGPAGHAAAMAYTARLLALEPWREEAHRQLMLLLASSGQRGAALAQFEACRRVLAEELGVEPGAETVALYSRIRDGQDRLGIEAGAAERARAGLEGFPPGSPAAAAAAPPFLSPAALGPETRTPLMARQHELARLDGLLELALAGHGQAAFVTGEAGTGKTALIEEFARRAQAAHADLVVAGGNCNAYSGIGDPYLPFREIMGLLTGDVERRWAAGTLSGEQARRLWNLIPQAAQALAADGPDLVDIFVPGPSLVARARAAVPGGAPWLDELQALVNSHEPGGSQAGLKQADLFEQYARVLATLAQAHPLLLILDDLQWADSGSTSLLFHLGRQLASAGSPEAPPPPGELQLPEGPQPPEGPQRLEEPQKIGGPGKLREPQHLKAQYPGPPAQYPGPPAQYPGPPADPGAGGASWSWAPTARPTWPWAAAASVDGAPRRACPEVFIRGGAASPAARDQRVPARLWGAGDRSGAERRQDLCRRTAGCGAEPLGRRVPAGALPAHGRASPLQHRAAARHAGAGRPGAG